jgi:peptidoglycan L-alanyl-D-glutamate endopeptidase CwlK
MASRTLTDLLRPAYERAERFVVACERAGIVVVVYCTYRSLEEQAALYAQSRETLAGVNALRFAAGLTPINDAANRQKVTDARPGESLHNYRLAFDCVVLQAGKPAWDGNAPIWTVVGEIGEAAGLAWAGRWRGKLREVGHFQYSGGLTLAQLQAGLVPRN